MFLLLEGKVDCGVMANQFHVDGNNGTAADLSNADAAGCGARSRATIAQYCSTHRQRARENNEQLSMAKDESVRK